MNVCVTANSAYVRYLYVMLTSLFINNGNNPLDVYVMNRDFSMQDMEILKALAIQWNQKIVFIKVDGKEFNGLPTTDQYKLEVYFRLLMPYKLPLTVQRAIYLDTDIIVQKSLQHLYELELEESQYIAACADMESRVCEEPRKSLFKRTNDFSYFNSGVMLWDLGKIRGKFRFEEFIFTANLLYHNLIWPDQDILNYIFYNHVKYLDKEIYNCLVYNEVLLVKNLDEKNVILHFANCAPWRIGKKSKLNRVWWDYAARTPFYADLLREQMERAEEYAKSSIDALKYQVSLWKRAYQLVRTGKIESYMQQSACDFYIYGAGRMAENIFGEINMDEIRHKIIAVIDREKQSMFMGIPIIQDVSSVKNSNRSCVIVTPLKEVLSLVADIKNSLPMADVITLENFLTRCDSVSCIG